MKYLLLLLIISTSAMADVSLYHGLVTRHLFLDNSSFNNDNEVTILKVDGLFAGTMINSYNRQGAFVGYQWDMFDKGKLDVDVGLSLISGYQERNVFGGNSKESILMALPVFSVSYEVAPNISLQVNNMAGIVVNSGIRLDF